MGVPWCVLCVWTQAKEDRLAFQRHQFGENTISVFLPDGFRSDQAGQDHEEEVGGGLNRRVTLPFPSFSYRGLVTSREGGKLLNATSAAECCLVSVTGRVPTRSSILICFNKKWQWMVPLSHCGREKTKVKAALLFSAKASLIALLGSAACMFRGFRVFYLRMCNTWNLASA